MRVLGRSLSSDVGFNDYNIPFFIKDLIPKFQTNSFINLSNIKIPDEVVNYLSRGLTFIPNQGSLYKTYCDLVAILVDDEGFDLDQLFEVFDKMNKTRLNNTTNTMRNEVKSFIQNNKNKIIVTKADKTSHIVVLNVEEYIKMGYDIINRFGFKMYEDDLEIKYKQLRALQFRVTLNLNKCFDLKYKSRITLNNCRFLPYLYLLPKTHKEPDSWLIPNELPNGRPIISCRNAIFSSCSIFLNNKIKDYVFKEKQFIKDSFELTKKICKLHETVDLSNCKLITFDVKELYLNINIIKLLNSFRNFLNNKFNQSQKNALVSALRCILFNQYFLFNNEIYKQSNGIYMGNTISPTLAYLYLIEFDHRVMNDSRVKYYARYIDDVFIITSNDYVFPTDLLKEYDLGYSDLSEGRIVTFLDLMIWINGKFEIAYSTFFKSTHPFSYIHYASWHPASVKRGIVRSQFIRIIRTNSDIRMRNFYIELLSRKFLLLNYPPKLIKKVKNELFNPHSRRYHDDNEKEINKWKHITYHPVFSNVAPLVYKFMEEHGKERKFRIGFMNANNTEKIISELHPAYSERINRKNAIFNDKYTFESTGPDCYRPFFEEPKRDLRPGLPSSDLRNAFSEAFLPPTGIRRFLEEANEQYFDDFI